MSNIHFLQLADYKQPVISENKREEWVDFGDDNNYYQFLIDRYNGSTTNQAVINNICKLIYGKGLTATNAQRKPNEYAQMVKLFSKETLRKIVKDLKLLGEFNLQLIYNDKKSAILRVEHLPTNLVRAEKCNKDGEIEAIYYSDNWQDTKKFQPKRIPLFGFGSKADKLEVLRVGNYTIGQKYYSNVDYLGGLSYATLEEEISNYLINEVQNGFSGTKVVNFNNGVPTEEQQQIIQSKVKSTLTGSKGKKVIVAFNSDETKKTTIDDIPLNDAPEHYKYLSDECLAKIMLSHNVTSPLLFGIATTTGFSSNADELKNSYVLFENMVIKPFQETIFDGLDKILAFNGISLELSFKQLQPLDNDGDLTKVVETPTQLSSHIDEIDLSKFGEEIDLNEWELVDSRPVDYNEEERLNAEVYALNNPKKSLFSKVIELAGASTGIARTKSPSEQDTEKFITRYRYSGNPSPEREFCKKMISANKLYRIEDINAMSEMNVNPGFGMHPTPNKPYDIFLWKGGGKLTDSYNFGTCKHFWTREMYRKIGTGKNTAATQSTPAQVRKAGEIAPINDKRGYVAPHDM